MVQRKSYVLCIDHETILFKLATTINGIGILLSAAIDADGKWDTHKQTQRARAHDRTICCTTQHSILQTLKSS